MTITTSILAYTWNKINRTGIKITRTKIHTAVGIRTRTTTKIKTKTIVLLGLRLELIVLFGL